MIEHLPNASGVYAIMNTTNGKIYVGEARIGVHSRGIRDRCRRHLSAFRNGKNSAHLQKAWDKYGSEAFRFVVLELCPSETCGDRQDYFIEHFKSWDREFGYNIDRASRGFWKVSEETRIKLSQALKGKGVGRKLSRETVEKISNSNRGKTRSQAFKERMRELNNHSFTDDDRKKAEEVRKHPEILEKMRLAAARRKGHHSEESKQKRSKAMSSKRWFNNGQVSKRLETCPEGWVPGRISWKRPVDRTSPQPQHDCE